MCGLTGPFPYLYLQVLTRSERSPDAEDLFHELLHMGGADVPGILPCVLEGASHDGSVPDGQFLRRGLRGKSGGHHQGEVAADGTELTDLIRGGIHPRSVPRDRDGVTALHPCLQVGRQIVPREDLLVLEPDPSDDIHAPFGHVPLDHLPVRDILLRGEVARHRVHLDEVGAVLFGQLPAPLPVVQHVHTQAEAAPGGEELQPGFHVRSFRSNPPR